MAKETAVKENIVSLDAHGQASDFAGQGKGVIPASIARDTQNAVETLQKSALDELGAAFDNLLEQEKKSAGFYAHVIKATMKCLQAGLTRANIADYLLKRPGSNKDELEVGISKVKYSKAFDGKVVTDEGSPGRVSKYVKLAQWSMGKFTEGETRPESVTIMGRASKTPVEALESNLCSYSAVYTAWRNATAQVMDLSDWGTDVETVAYQSAPDLRFTVRRKKKSDDGSEYEVKEAIKVGTSRASIRGTLKGLLGTEQARALPLGDKIALAKMMGLTAEPVIEEESASLPEAA